MMMRRSDAPTARAASMNSRSFSESTCPRTRRATPIQAKIASRKMMNRIDVLSPMTGSRNVSPPMNSRTTITATRNGNARKTSVTRIRTSSSFPPRRPAIAPTAVPMITAMMPVDDADEDRGPDAVQQPGVDVAADVVGAEPRDRLRLEELIRTFRDREHRLVHAVARRRPARRPIITTRTPKTTVEITAAL